MAKTIKFNLICDGNPIRTIEDLQNNFSIEDVLEYYNNKLLQRWLYVRGYDKEFQAVSSIENKESMDIIKELIRIFDIEADENKVEESVYMIEYKREHKELCSIYEQQNYKVSSIIDDYESGYYELVNDIFMHSDDAARIKADINEITSNYYKILRLNHRELFYELKEKSFLAIMCLIMNEKSRYYYIPILEASEDGSLQYDTVYKKDKNTMYVELCKMIKQKKVIEKLGENIKVFAGATDEYWKDLEPKGKKYMILSMESGDFVRASGNNGGDMSVMDVADKFVIIDGIDYKSKSDTHKLVYMEV